MYFLCLLIRKYLITLLLQFKIMVGVLTCQDCVFFASICEVVCIVLAADVGLLYVRILMYNIIKDFFFLQKLQEFLIRNEDRRKCVQVNEVQVSSRLSLQECRADSALQEWHWNPETRSISNQQTGGCLTAPQIQEHESVRLQACSSDEEDREGQAWSCSKKGLLTLHGKGLHLSAHHDSSKVFLSKDRGKGSKWRTLANQTVCEETDSTHHGPNVLQDSQQTLSTGPRILTQIRYWHCKRSRLKVLYK